MCKAKLKGANLRELKRESKGYESKSSIRRESKTYPDREEVLLSRHFDNSLSVYLFLEIEPFSLANKRNYIIKE